ncbi:peroxide stress protein YaaA [Eubacteriaceae bacterium ES3]|nr:peroxide stress protein YaaA [Eubacteriaceae bacterium ES3]
MRIIISPAKKMKIDLDSMAVRQRPDFYEDSEVLLKKLKNMSYADLKALWQCSDAIAEENFKRLKNFPANGELTSAIFSYQGIQYQMIAPHVFSDSEFEYLEKYLRILSGFYGIVRPFDGVSPYRLEMQAKLSIVQAKNLYDFWGSKLAEKLMQETDFILNLASKEYSKVITKHLPANFNLINCTFGEDINGKVKEKGTMVKMARGEMVRFLAENNFTEAEDIKAFNISGFKFQASLSNSNHYVFTKSI